MQELLKSASKLVLLFVVFILGVSALFSIAWGIVKGTLEPIKIVEIFGSALTFILGYYFASKGDPNLPYAGK